MKIDRKNSLSAAGTISISKHAKASIQAYKMFGCKLLNIEIVTNKLNFYRQIENFERIKIQKGFDHNFIRQHQIKLSE